MHYVWVFKTNGKVMQCITWIWKWGSKSAVCMVANVCFFSIGKAVYSSKEHQTEGRTSSHCFAQWQRCCHFSRRSRRWYLGLWCSYIVRRNTPPDSTVFHHQPWLSRSICAAPRSHPVGLPQHWISSQSPFFGFHGDERKSYVT